jgi:hypothetical protein
MRGGAKTRTDAVRQDPTQHQWVKKNTDPQKHFDAWKEKETFKEAIHEFINQNFVSISTVQHTQNVPMYEIPSSMDHTSESQALEHVSNTKKKLQSYVKLLKDPSSVKILQNLLERCNTEVEGKLEQKIVNHLHTRRRTSRELRLNANIRDFNMGDITLDLGCEVNFLPKKTWQCMGKPTLGYSPV